MTAIGRGLDFVLAVIGVLAWGFTAFVLGSRFISHTAGELLGIGILLSAGVYLASTYVQERRTELLGRGRCPRCQGPVAMDHRHRRWDPETSRWLAPETSWECRACAYAHGEAWACPACPE